MDRLKEKEIRADVRRAELRQETQKEIDDVEKTISSVGATPYLQKKRNTLYKKLEELK